MIKSAPRIAHKKPKRKNHFCSESPTITLSPTWFFHTFTDSFGGRNGQNYLSCGRTLCRDVDPCRFGQRDGGQRFFGLKPLMFERLGLVCKCGRPIHRLW